MWKRCRAATVLTTASCVVAVVFGGAAASGRPAVSTDAHAMAGDRSATIAYREAELAYEKAVIAAAAASTASIEALATRLDGECPGVVAGVEKSMRGGSGSPRSPRQEGEADRGRRQWSDLTDEANRAIELTRSRPYEQAALRFARKVQTLRWSDRFVTAYEHAKATAIEWEVQGALPPVCADMKVWVASGYTRLAAATKAFVAQREAANQPLNHVFDRMVEGVFALLSGSPLGPYEGPRAGALSRRIARLGEERETALKGVFSADMRVRYALGVSSAAELREFEQETAKLNAKRKMPSSGARVIGRGRTVAGSSYTVWIEGRKHRGGGRSGRGMFFEGTPMSMPRGCRRWVDILESEQRDGGVLGAESGEPHELCLFGSPKPPLVSCEGERRTIELQTRARARRVRLTLRNGRQIVSRVAIVPRRLGGPAGVYYQAVRVWASPPVSLTELDRRGRPLVTARLPRTPKCVTEWPFVRGYLRMIASGRIPDGPGFSILGVSEGTSGAAIGGNELSLRVEVGGERGREGFTPEPSGPFAWQFETGCRPHEYAILFGVLENARDTVWARGPAGLIQLRRARIPASLHAHGVLAYAAFPAVPSELVVRGRGGKTVQARKLTRIGREARETCEGEAEPPG